MATVSREVRQFVKQLVKQGITRPGDVQKRLKSQFGKGLMFRDLGPLLRGEGKTPPRPPAGDARGRKKVRKKKASRNSTTRKVRAIRTGAPRGRRAAVTPERRFAFVVMFRREGTTEYRGSHTKTEAASEVQQLIDAGVAVNDIALYERNDFETSTTVSIG